jgi:light-regulated signal transduction histidine kinase (bacteriophytochrome)
MLYMVEDLNEMTDELRRERKNLKIANEELESFSYSVSHDLRAPLRAINGFSGILMENYAGSLGSDGARICKIINDSTLKMGRLIDDLLAFSRLNRTEIVRTSIDMTRLAQDVYLELTSPEQRQAINWKSGQLCHAEGDLALMRQVWINLIANAIKFSSKNSSPAIEINCRRLNGECEYCIRDNGVGFDMRYADKLFGVFQRLHTENEFEGTGVGLAIVNNIITRHGGWIKAEGKVDSGAAFYFSLPV